MNPGNTAQGRRTRGQHQWSPSPRHAHMITPVHEDEESLLSLHLSCPQSALDFRRSRRNRRRCRRPRRTFLRSPPSVSASLSLRAGAEVGPGRRGEAAGSEAANGGEDTDNDRPLKRRRREERQRERGDALQENLSSRKRERELKWRRRHPVSQSFNPASK